MSKKPMKTEEEDFEKEPEPEAEESEEEEEKEEEEEWFAEDHRRAPSPIGRTTTISYLRSGGQADLLIS
jgi:hypothetical protein